jgi:transposase
MRGADEQTGALFSYLSPEAIVPKDHPLRAIRPLVNAALARLSPDFTRLYAPTGRALIAPEKLLRALHLQAFYSVRSERQLIEQLTYNMLLRWFVGLSMDCTSLGRDLPPKKWTPGYADFRSACSGVM